jgi:hypothetical protein
MTVLEKQRLVILLYCNYTPVLQGTLSPPGNTANDNYTFGQKCQSVPIKFQDGAMFPKVFPNSDHVSFPDVST